jgi:hypothetical protein
MLPDGTLCPTGDEPGVLARPSPSVRRREVRAEVRALVRALVRGERGDACAVVRRRLGLSMDPSRHALI